VLNDNSATSRFAVSLMVTQLGSSVTHSVKTGNLKSKNRDHIFT